MSQAITSILTNRSQYPKLLNGLKALPPEIRTARLRTLCIEDLFFLLVYGLGRKDADRDWIFDRCREVQASPNGHLDLWAREHYKSTIITFAQTIQDILRDPELTVGIFSHTRPIAKGFLRQIKREFEGNALLREWFSDIIWENPGRDAPKWSEDDGLVLCRKGNPKESTIEAWGLVDGQPTSKHFKLMVYDDVVTIDSVTSPEMIAKVTNAWALSRNLTSEGGQSRYIGTRYHFNDTYKTIMDRGAASPRTYAATVDGTVDGVPVLLRAERLASKRREMGPYVFACQMMQDPKADETQGFKEEWLRYFVPDEGREMNRYIVVDPASEKKKGNDYTAAWVIGLGPDRNYYVLDFYRDRLNLKQRADLIFRLHRKWQPQRVGYEKYGMMADIEHMRDRMERENYRFEIAELGGQQPKPDRIRRLVPVFSEGRLYLPHEMWKTDYEGVSRDLVSAFIEEEYKAFPVALHDDMLDALSRILDENMEATWPMIYEEPKEDRYSMGRRRKSGWMAA